MKKKNHVYTSRRRTPWDNMEEEELTPTQKFVKKQHNDHYSQRHPDFEETGEAALINSFVPKCCPYCGFEESKRFGKTGNGIQRYKCQDCGKTYLPTTATIFDSHKISISEWVEYCENLFRYVSISADSWNNKNAFSTSKYWLEKLFAVLEHSQDGIMLGGRVWLDETYYKVSISEVKKREDGKEYRGLSENQICIGVACTKNEVVCVAEGKGKPSQKRTWEAFSSHIESGSTIVHDGDNSHKKLVAGLSLKDESYNADRLKAFANKDNPLNRVNQVHRMLKAFLGAHKSFTRRELQGYLNLFAFVCNPPFDKLEKVEKLLILAFSIPKLLRYRDQYPCNTKT